MAAGLYWLVSYPKSGNTWIRSFLRALESPERDLDINQLEIGASAGLRSWIEVGSGLSLDECTECGIGLIRPLAYKFWHQQATRPYYHKVHDAYVFNDLAQPIFPADAAAGVLYITRHPFDVAVSLANHNNSSLQQAVDLMCDDDHRIVRFNNRSNTQVEQRLLNWSNHVASWLQSPHHLRLVKYEDMQQKPQETFAGIAEFLGFQKSTEDIDTALAACQFETLKAKELKNGFREKPSAAGSFFRTGKVGEGRERLTLLQQQQLHDCHAEMMQTLGYEP